MVRKEFTYRGFKIEDLQKMSIEEFANSAAAEESVGLVEDFAFASRSPTKLEVK